MTAKRQPPLVFGYLRSMVDDPEYQSECREQLAVWCVRENWHLGAVFCDSGGVLDDDRVGFRGLLHALSLPNAIGAVVLNSLHLSPRPQVVVTSMVLHIRRKGCAIRLRDGGLPDEAARLCAGQPELSR